MCWACAEVLARLFLLRCTCRRKQARSPAFVGALRAVSARCALLPSTGSLAHDTADDAEHRHDGRSLAAALAAHTFF